MYNGKTQLVGVIGHPVSHSLSPIMHNAVLANMGINAVYIPIPCEPDQLGNCIAGLRAMKFLGANITVPFKEAILQHIDELSPLSKFIGSVNTIYWKDGIVGGKLCGTTTDPYGAIHNFLDAGHQMVGKRIAILGNGGVARALAFVLCTQESDRPSHVTILGRDIRKVDKLCQEIINTTPYISPEAMKLSQFASNAANFDIIINGTSVGMHPQESQSPLPKDSLLAQHIVYDIVYTPAMTQLLLDAQDQGSKIVTGTGMLVHQGAVSFEHWFSQATPDNRAQRVQIMKESLK